MPAVSRIHGISMNEEGQEKDMKKVLKYIIAVLLVGSFAAWFFPVISAGVEMNLLKLLKVSFGYYTAQDEIEVLVYGSCFRSFSAYSWWIAAFGGITLLEIFLTTFFRRKLPYIISFIGSVVNCIAVIALLWAADRGLSQLEIYIEETGNTLTGTLQMEPFIIWFGVFALVIILSLLGIWLWGRADRKAADEEYEDESAASADIYPEEFGYDPVYPAGEEEISVSQDVLSGGGFLNQYGGDTPEKREYQEFHGAVLGENGRFRGKAYPLKYEEESFFVSDGADISISDREADTAIASVYYAEEYAEYCIRPMRRMSVFLESGQPLGRDRIYYLPRGMKIHVWNRYPDGGGNIYTLA